MSSNLLRFSRGVTDINSGINVFDRQCNFITTGNHWGNCQLSAFVRPVSETECDGKRFEYGELFDADMKVFKDIPPRVYRAIRMLNADVVVSEIRHHIGPHSARCKVVHGYIITTPDNRLVAVIQTLQGPQSLRVLEAVLPYVADTSAGKLAVAA